MLKQWLLILMVLLLHAWWTGSAVAEVFDPATESKVLSYVKSTMKCRKVPGLTMAVVKGNDTWTHGFGIADIDTGRNVTSQSQFSIASLTKAFTMTLLGMLLDENGFTWSSKVSDVLGYEFKFVDELRTKHMTIKDILSHRTGLARLDEGVLAGYSINITTRAGLCKRLEYVPAKYDFRDTYLYHNSMYMLAGHICEVLGKDTWENLVTSRLLKPLGMTSATLMRGPNDVFSDSAAHPHIYRDGRFEKGTPDIYDIFPLEPVGAILASAEDMTKWILFNMRRGKIENGTQLIKKELLDEAIKATTAMPVSRDISQPEFPASYIVSGCGYGWMTASYRGFKHYWHTAGLYSYITYLWIFADKGTNVGLLTSVNGPAFQSSDTLKSIMYYVSDLLLDKEPWMNETTACTYPEPWHTRQSMNSSVEENGQLTNAEEYEGSYGHRFLPDIQISVMPDDQTKLRIVFNRISGVLRPSTDKDRFLYKITSPWELALSMRETNVTFVRNDGVVAAAMFQYEVDVTFTKGASFTDPIPHTNGSISMIFNENKSSTSTSEYVMTFANSLDPNMVPSRIRLVAA